MPTRVIAPIPIARVQTFEQRWDATRLPAPYLRVQLSTVPVPCDLPDTAVCIELSLFIGLQ